MSLERGNPIERNKTRMRGNSVYGLFIFGGIMRCSTTIILLITLAALSPSAFSQVSVEAGEIISVNPSIFSPGIPTPVTICIRNTGSKEISARVVCASKPAGWNVSPISSPVGSLNTGLMDCINVFTITAPMSGGNGTIVWELWSDDFLMDDLLDTYYQHVNSPSLPDLIVEDIAITPTQVLPGSNTLTITIRGRNIGQSPSNPCHTSIEIFNGDGNYSFPIQILCPVLNPGQSSTTQIPIHVTFTSPGSYVYHVITEADCYHEVAETNESNNLREESFIISVNLPSIRILSPNGAEEYFTGYTYDIRWQTLGDIPTVKIEFSKDNGVSWVTLADSIPNKNGFKWIVEESQVSPESMIRVSDGSYPSIYDTNNDVFQVLLCQLELISDINQDCIVNLEDLSILASEWLKSGKL